MQTVARRLGRFAMVAGMAAALFALPRSARAEGGDSAAWRSNLGFQTHLGPVLLIPTDPDESFGGGLEFGLRYGLKAGPTVLAPGARAAGYYQPKRFIGDVMGTFRVTLPAGPFAPFLEGGVGPGGASNPGQGGVAILAGGGLMIHFGDVFGLGARASWETITSTGFSVLSVGPMLQFGF